VCACVHVCVRACLCGFTIENHQRILEAVFLVKYDFMNVVEYNVFGYYILYHLFCKRASIALKQISSEFKRQTISIFRTLPLAFINRCIIVCSTVITFSNVYTICDGKSAVHCTANWKSKHEDVFFFEFNIAYKKHL
jgi:hypothetical protein